VDNKATKGAVGSPVSGVVGVSQNKWEMAYTKRWSLGHVGPKTASFMVQKR